MAADIKHIIFPFPGTYNIISFSCQGKCRMLHAIDKRKVLSMPADSRSGMRGSRRTQSPSDDPAVPGHVEHPRAPICGHMSYLGERYLPDTQSTRSRSSQASASVQTRGFVHFSGLTNLSGCVPSRLPGRVRVAPTGVQQLVG